MSEQSQRLAGLTEKQRKALEVMAKAKGQLAARPAQREPIAIVGLACRLPGAPNAAAYWKLLRDGVDAIREVPPDRWDTDAYFDPNPATPGKMNTRWGGFLDAVDGFDAHFFGISHREAVQMDPQQRLVTELAYEALEDAGLAPAALAGAKVGVFLGISNNDYGRVQLNDPKLSDPFVGTGSALCIGANRLSYLFDFQGPSMAVDTACSSSLVALHLACNSLWNGEAVLALAAGANLMLTPALTVNFSKAGFMAPDGRCKAFDARANGYVRGEGAGVVVLKPLSRAVADGDRIYALVRGAAVNQDGKSNGLTAPNRPAQEAVLRDAYARSGVNPAHVQYIEAHGTGTSLGDPIEAQALGAVLGPGREPSRPCLIGSVKSNIGHLEAAAGIASIIKVALSLYHREIPPSLHYQKPNPHIGLESLPLKVQTTHTPWPVGPGAALAGVSSFGFGGTNAHVVMEEAPTPAPAEPTPVEEDRPFLLPLSARSPEALQALARSFVHFLAGRPATFIDVIHSACLRREHHDHRLAVIARTAAEARGRLEAFVAGESSPDLLSGRKTPGRRSKLAWVFSGQGPQWWGMGRQLLQREPVFRAAVERIDGLLKPLAGWSLLEEFRVQESESRINRTEVAQPALFAVQVALAELWKSWGVVPHTVVGHSLGEVAAAHVAGVLSLEDAVRVIYHRGRVMQQAAGKGRTAAVEGPQEETLRGLAGLEGQVGVAATNSPQATTLSGDVEVVDEVLARLRERGAVTTPLRTDCAFHSHQMEPLLPDFTTAITGIRPQSVTIPMISTVTAQSVHGLELDAGYWGRNLRQTVRFAEAVGVLLDKHHDVFLEVGPHPVLARPLAQCAAARKKEATILGSLNRREEERPHLLRSLGALYVRGYAVDWSKVHPAGRYVPLPSYPWQRVRCWLEAGPETREAQPPSVPAAAAGSHPMLGRHIRLAGPAGLHVWEAELDRRRFPFLEGYATDGAVLLPAAACVEMALAAAEEALGPGTRQLADVAFPAPLLLPEDGPGSVQVVLAPAESGETSFDVYSRAAAAADAPWTHNATGKIRSNGKVTTNGHR
jgi:myxalamid-type polyketide synthase MxaE and MxaD